MGTGFMSMPVTPAVVPDGMLIGSHNLPPELPWAVSMIRTEFADEIGNKKPLSGTGFWVRTEDEHTIFATNRHNVDASLAFRHDKDLSKCKLARTEVHVRRGGVKNLAYEPGRFFEVLDPWWILDEAADVAILIDPVLVTGGGFDDQYRVITIPIAYIADGAWINTRLQMMDECYFIGYPSIERGGKVTFLYDVRANFPIARQAIIASGPFYTHEDIKVAGPILVSGLSFHGSSGSPVLTPSLGIPPGSVMARDSATAALVPVEAEHRGERIIGIMTGAFYTDQHQFTHAGLSYFTRAGYILNLIKRAHDLQWMRAG
jgi:hypothetical protein